MSYKECIEKLKFDDSGLIATVVQDYHTKAVLMVAYMNKETLEKSINIGKAVFYSRSRQKEWLKGEESGNFLSIVEILYDCDADTLLIKAICEGDGVACHTGEYSCFHNTLKNSDLLEKDNEKLILYSIYDTVIDRANNPIEGAYTNYLLEKGIDKILKKVGEETAEVIIAAKNTSKEEVIYETADLLYHLSVMLYTKDVKWEDVFSELKKRHK
jgi:phosphoribosyl-ATP pyrophosphohydrolase/phosphoribosyl-AMP cyclohydrolase